MKKIKKLILNIFKYFRFVRIAKDSIGFTSNYLSKVCDPSIVVDVGVGYGTYPLYESFPNATFILIEPLKEYEKYIDKVSKIYDCEVVYKALGEKEGEMNISFDRTNPQMASLFERTALTKDKGDVKRTIEVTTLEKVLTNKLLKENSVLLKIDTEGAELNVLKGAKSILSDIDFVIVEVSIAKRFENSYEFEDLIIFMRENNFYVYSFLTMNMNSRERQNLTDILFKRK